MARGRNSRRSLLKMYLDLFEGEPLRWVGILLTPLFWMIGVLAAADWASRYELATTVVVAVVAAMIFGGIGVLSLHWQHRLREKAKLALDQSPSPPGPRSTLAAVRQATPLRRFFVLVMLAAIAVMMVWAGWLGFQAGVAGP